jgi:hypothetical protein
VIGVSVLEFRFFGAVRRLVGFGRRFVGKWSLFGGGRIGGKALFNGVFELAVSGFSFC